MNGGRIATFFAAAFLTVTLVCCAVVKIISAAPRPQTMNLDNAQHEVLPWATSDEWKFPHAWMMQVCCDCGLVHRWLIVPTIEEGVHAYIWRWIASQMT